MKIAFLQHPSFPMNIQYHGGIERCELNELEHLRRRGIEADLFVSHCIGSHSLVKVLFDAGWKNRFLQWIYYILFFVRTGNYSILHGHFTPMLALFRPTRTVVHFHGNAIFELPLYRIRFFRNRYYRCRFLFNSEWLRRAFSEAYPDLPAKNSILLYYGCDIIESLPKIPERNYKGIINICWYGVWEGPKGLFDLLDAIGLLWKKRQDFAVFIGGSATFEGRHSESESIDARTRTMAALIPCVTLVGPIKHSDLPAFLSSMHVGVFNPSYREPWGLVGTEMMAAGLGVVATNYGGPAEYVAEGTGLLVPPADPQALVHTLEMLLDDRESIFAMGKRAREHVIAHFTWQRHAEQLLEIYRSLECER